MLCKLASHWDSVLFYFANLYISIPGRTDNLTSNFMALDEVFSTYWDIFSREKISGESDLPPDLVKILSSNFNNQADPSIILSGDLNGFFFPTDTCLKAFLCFPASLETQLRRQILQHFQFKVNIENNHKSMGKRRKKLYFLYRIVPEGICYFCVKICSWIQLQWMYPDSIQ